MVARAMAALTCGVRFQHTEVNAGRGETMYQALEATIKPDGSVQLLQPVTLPAAYRALVIVLDDSRINETALLSEAALAADWNRPEEDAAWSYLQTEK